MLSIAVRPTPLELKRNMLELPSGSTIEDIVRHSVPERWYSQALVKIANNEIPQHLWNRVRPKEGHLIEIIVVPSGGGNGLRLLLIVGVIALAAAAGPAGVAALGLTGTAAVVGGAVITGAVTTAGLLAVNALVPLQQPDLLSGKRNSPTYNLEGSRNYARLLGVVPVVLGRHRITPPLAAKTTTEIAGNDVFLRMLVTWGHGPILLEDLKIEEAPLTNYSNIEVESSLGIIGSIPELSLYSNAINEEVVLTELTNAEGWISRTTAFDADEISVDIVFPRGLIRYSDNGKNIDSYTVNIQIEYRVVGASEWVVEPTLITRSKTTSALRRSQKWSVSRGQYEVRLRRSTQDTPLDRIITDSVWTVLRTITHVNPVNERSVATTALRIKASQQVNGTVDRLNGVVTSVALDWNGTNWTSQPTRNPASLLRLVLQGPSALNPIPDIEINLTQLEYWHEYCDLHGYTCDVVVDWESTTNEIAAIIASCGRAAIDRSGGTWSVAIDEPKSIVVQEFTPRSLEGLSQRRIYIEEAHALRIGFLNEEKGWGLDERVVYNDGYDIDSAIKIENIEWPGVTTPSLIHHFGRLALARARFQQERTDLATDWRHLIAQPGDLINVAHDLVLWGTGWGRIKEIELNGSNNVVSVTLDEIIVLESGKAYVLRAQRSNGTTIVASISNAVGVQNRFVFTTPILAVDSPAIGNQVIVGEVGKEVQTLLVIGRQGGSDLRATLACVPYKDFSNVENEDIPPFDSLITLPPGQSIPIIQSVRSDEITLQRQVDGTLLLRVLVTIWSDGTTPHTTIAGPDVRWREVDSGQAWRIIQAPADAVEVWIDGVQRDQLLEIQARWRFINNQSDGEWSVLWQHKVIGPNLPPSDVSYVYQDGELMRWGTDFYADHAGFLLRTTNIVGGSWNSARPVHLGTFAPEFIAVEHLPEASVELLVKAITISGVESILAVRAPINHAAIPARHTIEVTDFRLLSWPGEKTGSEIVNGSLVALPTSAFWPDPVAAAWPNPLAPGFQTTWNTLRYVQEWTVPPYGRASDAIELFYEIEGSYNIEVKWLSGDIIQWDINQPANTVVTVEDYPPPSWMLAGTGPGSGLGAYPTNAYRGPLRVVENETFQVVVTIDGGSTALRPAINELRLLLRGRIEIEMMGNKEIEVNGTRMPTVFDMRVIIGVGGLLVGEGEARMIRVLEKTDPVLGVLVAAYNDAGTSVAAVADVSIVGT